MVDPEVKEVTGKYLDLIEAEFVNINQSSVRTVEGGHVELQQVGALSIDGDRVEMSKSAAAVINGSDIYLNQGMSVLTTCNNANLSQSFSPVILSGNNAGISKSAVGIMAAREIRTENTSSLLLIANKVEGNVTTLLDWRAALAFGAVVGGVFGMLSLFRKK